MVRQIRVKKNFKQNVETPLVTGDNKAYEIVWEVGNDAIGANMQIIATRDDLKMICDTCTIGEDGIARYILKNNMYMIPGRLKLMLSVVSGESILTERILNFTIIRGQGLMESNGVDGPPPFTEVVEEVENMKEHITDETIHKTETDLKMHENMENHLKDESVHKTERDLNKIKELEEGLRNVYIKKEWGKFLSAGDMNYHIGPNGLGITGSSFQDGTPTLDAPVEIVHLKDPILKANNTEAHIPGVYMGLGEEYDNCARDMVYTEKGKVYYQKFVCVLNKPEDFNFEEHKKQGTFNIFKSKLSEKGFTLPVQLCNYLVYAPPYSTLKEGFYCEDDYMYVILPASKYPTAESFNQKIQSIFESGKTFEVYYPVNSKRVEIQNDELLSLHDIRGRILLKAVGNIPTIVKMEYGKTLEYVIPAIIEAIEDLGGTVYI